MVLSRKIEQRAHQIRQSNDVARIAVFRNVREIAFRKGLDADECPGTSDGTAQNHFLKE
jgi:hypothetical protein